MSKKVTKGKKKNRMNFKKLVMNGAQLTLNYDTVSLRNKSSAMQVPSELPREIHGQRMK